ncbi:MAG TPA: efflux RND transporter periplasmic adaptor subunit [Candidatus Saccharimonadales bacterium]|jgi:RND family efflux transporter MFP subunit|nr:efflux RND transporter periplasmic adaptor subunit [Candidatus Saccharimonadales bacterium]
MKNKRVLILIGVIIVLIVAGVFINYKKMLAASFSSNPVTTASVRFVTSTFSATGTVTAQNQATLTFQTPGKLVYLPFKEGDTVSTGQVVAQLDTYALQRSLTLALNAYRTTRDTFDQTQDNLQDNLLKSQVTPTYSNAVDNNTAVNNAIQRIADQAQAGLDNSVINVELANYALQLSRLISPLRGIITHEGVTTSGINITPATTFTVADPSSMVFRANIPTQDIYYINEGGKVSIAVDGIQNKIDGTVVKIYPSKVILLSGEAVYQVDVESDQLKKIAKLDDTGTAIIYTNAENVALVPAWTVLAGKYIWIDNGGTPELREVTVGKVHGNEIEITGGLSPNDKIIVDPKYIPSMKYQIL